jgi:hypothetical protein
MNSPTAAEALPRSLCTDGSLLEAWPGRLSRLFWKPEDWGPRSATFGKPLPHAWHPRHSHKAGLAWCIAHMRQLNVRYWH